MPIAKGEEWGRAGSLPAGAPVVQSDAEAAALVDRDAAPVVLGLAAGDLARTLGVRTPYDPASTRQLVPVDAVAIELDGSPSLFAVAHVRIGRALRDAKTVAIMNAAFIGRRNIAPRGHPGDGKVDVVTFELGFTDRLKALQRMPTGSHLPHPGIRVRPMTEGTLDFDRAQRVWVDGEPAGTARQVGFRVVPDALVVAV